MAVNRSPSFSIADGVVVTQVPDSDEEAQALVIDPATGSITLAGTRERSFASTTPDFKLVRYDAAGSPDPTFGSGGHVQTPIGTGIDRAFAMKAQADGKLIVGGTAQTGSDFAFALARYNSDGTLDTTFGGDGKLTTSLGPTDDEIRDLAIQPDGKIVAVGYMAKGSGSTRDQDLAIVRYNVNGSLDTTFDGDGILTIDGGTISDRGESVWLQPDGKMLVAGNSLLVRVNPNGTLDTTLFGSGKLPLPDAGAYSVRTQSDGKILVGGESLEPTAAGTSSGFLLMRFNADGSPDATFDGDGRVVNQFGRVTDGARRQSAASDMIVQGDGKIVLAGFSDQGSGSSNFDLTLARYNTDGSLDSTFSGDGVVTTDVGAPSFDVAHALAIQADGRLVVAGSRRPLFSAGLDFVAARYTREGVLDPEFDTPTNTLDGTPGMVENDTVTLDSSVRVYDPELFSQGHYGGASVTVQRTGGANPEDAFLLAGAAPSASTEGSSIFVNSTVVGTVMTNSGGRFVLTFNSNATQSNVDAVLSRIAYTNTSDTPPASVPLAWTFSDGNTGAQGSGGPLAATGSTTVSITAVNDAPVNTVPGAQTVARDTGLAIVGVRVSDADAGSSPLTVSFDVLHGTLTVRNDVAGGVSASGISGNGTSTVTLTGGQNAINATLSANNGVVYQPSPAFSGADTLRMISNDGGAVGSGGTKQDTDTTAINVVSSAQTYLWSNLTHGQAVSFNPSTDTLRFDNSAIFAANVAVVGPSIVLTFAGKTVTLSTPLETATTSNIVFDSGSVLVVGDNMTGTSGDAAGNNIDGSAGNDQLIGLGGNDVLDGGAGGDRLNGGNGDDTVRGGAGNDVLIWSSGRDSFEGGADVDTADFSASGVGVSVSLAAGEAFAWDAASAVTGAQIASLAAVENVTGGALADLLVGDVGAHTLLGGGGNDVLRGGAGNDILIGGAGSDTAMFSGPRSAYTITRGGGALIVSGPDGVDEVRSTEALQFSDVLVRMPARGTDLNGDGQNDLLLRDTSNGSVSVNVMQGVSVASSVKYSWGTLDVLGTESDFNGDGKSDIVLRYQSSGNVQPTLMSGANYIGAIEYPWSTMDVLSAKSDFNGDGKSDFLLRYRGTGHVQPVLMDGLRYIGALEYPWSALDVLSAQSDFNGDGKTDMLLRYQANGHVQPVLMNGVNYIGALEYPWSALDVLSAQSDFNGDGKSDLLLRYRSNGHVQPVLMDGVNYIGALEYPWTPFDVLSAQSDFNGDGKSDILLRDPGTGVVKPVLMSGVNYIGAQDYGWAGREVLSARGDFNGDGKSDILLRDTTSGNIQPILMNGVGTLPTGAEIPMSGWNLVSATSDFNGDGNSDLAFVNAAGTMSRLVLLDGVSVLEMVDFTGRLIG